MSLVRSLLAAAVLLTLMWTISATQVGLEDSVGEGRDSKAKVKKALKEAAMLLGMVKDLGQLVVMIVGPLLQLKGVGISAFTALVTFFWFAYELLKTKEPTKLTVLLPPSLNLPHEEEKPIPPQPSVAILPVVTSSHDVHTFDYDDYNDNVYNYKQHFGNKRPNFNRPNFHVRR